MIQFFWEQTSAAAVGEGSTIAMVNQLSHDEGKSMSDEARKFGEARDADGNVVIQFMGPPRSDDALSLCLRVLTHQLKLKTPDADHGGGFFGGRNGYGVDFENDVFMMHHYCWCQTMECPWCRDCGCEGHYNTTDRSWAEGAEWIVDKECVNCREGLERRANFEHKPSGFQVRWYKYIGRGMEIQAEPAGDWTLHVMFTGVLASIGGPSLEDALQALERAEEQEAEDFKKSMEFAFSDEGRKLFQDMEDAGAIKTVGFGKKEP